MSCRTLEFTPDLSFLDQVIVLPQENGCTYGTNLKILLTTVNHLAFCNLQNLSQ